MDRDSSETEEHLNFPADRPLLHVLREVSFGIQGVVRSEIRLARAELRGTGGRVARHGLLIGACAALAILGILPLMAFCVIELGALLDGNYGLSALIIAAVMIVIGGSGTFLAYKKARKEDLSMTRTLEGLEEPIEAIDRKFHKMTGQTPRRRSA